MGIQVIDSKKGLSKNQIQKVKNLSSKFIETGGSLKGLDKFLVTNVLPNLTFQEGCVYNQIHYELDETTGHIKIVLGYSDPEEVKRRLKERLNAKKYLRKNSDDAKSRLWKTYENLKKYTNKSVRVPNPEEVVSQRTIFEEILEKMPNSDFKHYIQDCLN